MFASGILVGIAIGPQLNTTTFATPWPSVIHIPGLGAAPSSAPEAAAADDGSGDSGGDAPSVSAPATGEAVSLAGASEPASSAPLPAPPSATHHRKHGKHKKPPATEPTEGVVVHQDPGAGTYILAADSGDLYAVHSADQPTPGTRISVPLKARDNGTYTENGKRTTTATVGGARFRGSITYVDSTARTYTISTRGASLLVHAPAADANGQPELPKLNQFVTLAVSIEQPPAPSGDPLAPPPVCPGPADKAAAPPYCYPAVAVLRQLSLTTVSTFDSFDLEGIVQSVDTTAHTLVLSADDIREDGTDITMTAAPSIDLAALKPGQTIGATTTIDPNAPTGPTYALNAICVDC
jgi:hypothetical protein